MRTFLLIAVAALCKAGALAQPQSVKFGEVEAAYVQMRDFPADTAADAVFLYDYGEMSIEIGASGVNTRFIVHQRIKILKESGLRYADWQLDYNKKDGSIGAISGITHVEEGGVIKTYELARKDIFDEKAADELSVKKFSLPQARPGAVIEVKYEQIFNYPKMVPWYFQAAVPVLHSEYHLYIPDWYNYITLNKGLLKPERQTLQGFVREGIAYPHIAYIMKDIPAMRSEEYITCMEDYLASIHFQLSGVQVPGREYKPLMSDWNTVRKALLERNDFGGKIKKNPPLLASLNYSSHSDSLQHAAEIYYAFTQNAGWNESYGYLADQDAKELLTGGNGSSADLNLTLVSLLRTAGFDCHPGLISTRGHGAYMAAYPILDQFNHVIACLRAGGKWHYLDATDRHLPFGVLPVQDYNELVCIMMPKSHLWTELRPEQLMSKRILITADLDDADELSGSIKFNLRGYAARTARSRYTQHDKLTETYFRKELLSEWNSMNLWLDSLSFNDPAQDLQVTAKAQFRSPDLVQAAGDRVYMRPILTGVFEKNPFQAKERNFPVDFGIKQQWQYLINLKLPEGYTVEEMPKPVKITFPGQEAEFTYIATQMNNLLSVSYKLNINKIKFPPESYDMLKQIFDMIAAKQAEQIVILKP